MTDYLCERPDCSNTPPGDYRYCSDRCEELDFDPTPITVISPASPRASGWRRGRGGGAA